MQKCSSVSERILERGFICVITLWQALRAKPMPSKVKNKCVSLVPLVCTSITTIPHVDTSAFKGKHPGYSFFQFLEWPPLSPLDADTPIQQRLTKALGTRSIFFFLFRCFPYKAGSVHPASFKSIPRQQGDLHTNRLANLHPVWLCQQDLKSFRKQQLPVITSSQISIITQAYKSLLVSYVLKIVYSHFLPLPWIVTSHFLESCLLCMCFIIHPPKTPSTGNIFPTNKKKIWFFYTPIW